MRVANCSGFFGDRPSAATEMVEGGPIDVLTGDWLAELTMLILSRIRAKHPGGGFARTFVSQMEEVMGTCLDRGIKVVSNAGGLDPAGCAEAVSEVADKLGLSPTIAYVDGDDLMPRISELIDGGHLRPFVDGEPASDPDRVLTANAYLGCWGIVEALKGGADIVITGRVTDAAVVCGPAAWHHGWTPHDLDPLAGAVVAGHVIECGAQATGGNYSFFTEIDGRNEVGGRARFGFPWAEIGADGSSVIGKHDGTGGLVSVGTVTSQLLYEIGSQRYLGPDVTARFDTISLEQIGLDRVRISGTTGEAPPETLKVATNEMGGYRNSFAVALTGLDIEAKAELAQATFWDACAFGPDDFDSVDSEVVRTDSFDPATQAEATALWRVSVKDGDERKVGRAFTDAMIHTALASIPGMYALGGGPTPATPYGVYRPAKIDRALIPQYLHVLGGESTVVDGDVEASTALAKVEEPGSPESITGSTTDVPLGIIVGARSGDKGGDANLGVFVPSMDHYRWLRSFLTVERLATLLPEVEGRPIERFEFPNLRSLNFVLRGFLDEGVAASTRTDPQAKALGEWLRARIVPVPSEFLRGANEVPL
ncbi:MAG: DUF1446 domain-containing protein [Acidimicrobiales bacterium]|nr:DUF1446 domain-containing protein [Acidimicrobiales bacterium]